MINNSDMPAMPVMDEVQEHGQHYGLTKREHFAGLVMQGLVSGVNSSVKYGESHGWKDEDFAKEAVELADALLAELERTK